MRSDGVIRHNIWEKDDFFRVGGQRIDMDPAVVTLPEEAPLTWNFDWNKTPIGQCFDIRLEDGVISCGVVWIAPTLNDDTPKDLGVRFGGYYHQVVKETDKEGNVKVTACVLKGVSLFPLSFTPGFPKREKT